MCPRGLGLCWHILMEEHCKMPSPHLLTSFRHSVVSLSPAKILPRRTFSQAAHERGSLVAPHTTQQRSIRTDSPYTLPSQAKPHTHTRSQNLGGARKRKRSLVKNTKDCTHVLYREVGISQGLAAVMAFTVL